MDQVSHNTTIYYIYTCSCSSPPLLGVPPPPPGIPGAPPPPPGMPGVPGAPPFPGQGIMSTLKSKKKYKLDVQMRRMNWTKVQTEQQQQQQKQQQQHQQQQH